MKREETIFVLGRSGVGKSVLLKTIVGLIPQDSGEIWLDGEKTEPLDEDQMSFVRQRCGLVFQMPALLDSLKIYDNLVFGLSAINSNEVAKYCDWVRFPNSLLSRYPSEISFGNQKKSQCGENAS
ncbi:MAG: ATP-binding cassette domain-containing protein [Pseudomonadota bacterium]